MSSHTTVYLVKDTSGAYASILPADEHDYWCIALSNGGQGELTVLGLTLVEGQLTYRGPLRANVPLAPSSRALGSYPPEQIEEWMKTAEKAALQLPDIATHSAKCFRWTMALLKMASEAGLLSEQHMRMHLAQLACSD